MPGSRPRWQSGGGIVAQVEALRDLLRSAPSGTALDLVISPIALDQLERAADGYERSDGTEVARDAPAPRAAQETLERIREIAASPQARLHAMPFAAPRLPALLTSGLASHLDAQWRLGDETFERIVGERPDPTVARPPGLALDQASIDAMAAHGADHDPRWRRLGRAATPGQRLRATPCVHALPLHRVAT